VRSQIDKIMQAENVTCLRIYVCVCVCA